MAILKQALYTALAFLLIAACPLSSARAEESLQLHEEEIKAALLYNFLKYTEWPPEKLAPEASITVCVFGEDSFNEYVQPMEGRTVNQRSITVRHVGTVQDADNCHLLFLNAKEGDRWPALRDALSGKAVLTVSDLAGFTESGGMIEFGHKDNHIGVSLNIDAVKVARLSVEDRLLRLVTVVHAGAKP